MRAFPLFTLTPIVFPLFIFFFSFYGVSLRRRVRDSFDAGSRVTRSCNQSDAGRRTLFFFFLTETTTSWVALATFFLRPSSSFFFLKFFSPLLCSSIYPKFNRENPVSSFLCFRLPYCFSFCFYRILVRLRNSLLKKENRTCSFLRFFFFSITAFSFFFSL